MRRRKWKPVPKVRCDWTDEAYFGYGPTEYLQCRDAATHRGWADYWDGWQPDRERVHVCESHAQGFRVYNDSPRLYRFRTVSR